MANILTENFKLILPFNIVRVMDDSTTGYSITQAGSYLIFQEITEPPVDFNFTGSMGKAVAIRIVDIINICLAYTTVTRVTSLPLYMNLYSHLYFHHRTLPVFRVL